MASHLFSPVCLTLSTSNVQTSMAANAELQTMHFSKVTRLKCPTTLACLRFLHRWETLAKRISSLDNKRTHYTPKTRKRFTHLPQASQVIPSTSSIVFLDRPTSNLTPLCHPVSMTKSVSVATSSNRSISTLVALLRVMM
jgi:hypothetical protein